MNEETKIKKENEFLNFILWSCIIAHDCVKKDENGKWFTNYEEIDYEDPFTNKIIENKYYDSSINYIYDKNINRINDFVLFYVYDKNTKNLINIFLNFYDVNEFVKFDENYYIEEIYMLSKRIVGRYKKKYGFHYIFSNEVYLQEYKTKKYDSFFKLIKDFNKIKSKNYLDAFKITEFYYSNESIDIPKYKSISFTIIITENFYKTTSFNSNPG